MRDVRFEGWLSAAGGGAACACMQPFAGVPGPLWRLAAWLMGDDERPRAAADGAPRAEDLAAMRSGDHEAFGRLVRRYQKDVAAVMWRFANRPEDLDDLVHEVFVQAYLSRGRFARGAAFMPWLRGIAVHVGYQYWSRQHRHREAPEISLDAVGEIAARPEEADPAQARRMLDALLAGLSPRDRLVLTLVHIEKKPVAEVARLTGWSRTMVKVQAYRARARLRRLLKESEVSQ